MVVFRQPRAYLVVLVMVVEGDLLRWLVQRVLPMVRVVMELRLRRRLVGIDEGFKGG